MNETRRILESYLHQVGMNRPADAAQQYAVTLLRQQADHLDDVLRHNLPGDPQTRSRIIREFIYGAVPVSAEAELRTQILAEAAEYRAQNPAVPRIPADPFPGRLS